MGWKRCGAGVASSWDGMAGGGGGARGHSNRPFHPTNAI